MSRMRKTAVDAALSDYWQRAVRERRAFEIGLVIGQTGASSDALLTGIPVPSEAEDEEARSFEDVSIDWVQEYAKQIDRLLPGGVSVVGLFVVSAAPARAVVDQATFYLRAVAETLRLPDAFAGASGSSVHYVVHVCLNTSKTSAKSVFDILDAAACATLPVELKIASSDQLALRKFTATIAIDERIALRQSPRATSADDDDDGGALDELQQQLLPLAKRVQSAIGVVRSRACANGSSSDAASSETRAGSFGGAIRCLAYVLASESHVQTAAVECLKRDFLKSLLLRVELVRERLADGDDSDASTSELRSANAIAFPKRAAFPWTSALGPCAHFPALLHVFQDGEQEREAVQNALEILGAQDAGSSSSASLEFLESDAQQGKTSSSTTNTKSSAASTGAALKSASSERNGSNSVFIALAALLVLLAIVAQQVLQTE